MNIKFLLCLTVFSIIYFGTRAHGVDISNVSVSGSDITFDISWNNSWNSYGNSGPGANPNYPRNRSGVWVFIKVQNDVNNEWHHQKISTTAADHSFAIGSSSISFYPSSDGVGMMLHHGSFTTSNATFNTKVTFKMDAVPVGNLNFKVFAIEMVSSSDGSFHMGDGGFNYGVTDKRFDTVTVVSSNPSIPANALPTPGSPASATSPAICCNYPTGFYETNIMRYECSNEQFVEFLNTLTYDQQSKLVNVSPDAAANTRAFNFASANNENRVIRIQTPGISNTQPAVFACNYDGNSMYNEGHDGQNQAFGLSSIRRTLAYLDWCGMRPMSELEYEKFCRGSKPDQTPVARNEYEFAWGTDSAIGFYLANNTFPGWATERYSGTLSGGGPVAALINTTIPFATDEGPMRVGQFAGPATGRVAAGASYYGVMDLSGNVSELCYNALYKNTLAPTIRTDYGDGEIGHTINVDMGEHNVQYWPSSQNDSAFVARGGNYKDGYLSSTSLLSYLQISTRYTNTFNYIEPQPSYGQGLGIRGIRHTD